MTMDGKTPKSFGTHDGTFHADEVVACAFLLYAGLIEKEKIVRSRDLGVLEKCAYVCDVGGVFDPQRHLFDHHQSGYEGDLSSAGMVLEYLKQAGHLPAEEYDYLVEHLVKGVDLDDNGACEHMPGICTFSDVITHFNPPEYEAAPVAQDRSFFMAIDFALAHIARMLERYRYNRSYRQKVAECMEKYRDPLIFEEPVPWMENFFELGGLAHPAKFVIMPTRQGWKLRGIPPRHQDEMSVRLPLPKSWAGLLNGDLEQVCGIEGAIFCHKGRFISIWKTREAALKAYEVTLESVRD